MGFARSLLALALLTLAAGIATGREEAERAGMNPARLARIDAMIQGYVDARQIPGAVTLVVRRGEIVHVGVQGKRAFDGAEPMTRDTIFRIYSMTKPITSVATLMLYEEGRLRLTDPVAKWIPELAEPRVLRDPNGPLDATEPSPAPISVRDLLTHCSGLVYPFTTGPALAKAYQEAGILGSSSALAPDEWAKRLGALPLAHAPGTRWNYSVSKDVLGLLVARVSGLPLADFLRTRIF